MRKNFYPDFGFSGNDLAYHFILPNEIWIDGQVLSEETEYSIAIELIESDLMANENCYGDAFACSNCRLQIRREEMEKLILKHPFVVIPDSATRSAS